MATVAEIEAARSQAVRNADFQVVEAIARRNGSNSPKTRGDLNTLIDDLMAARTSLNGKAVAAQDSSPEMEAALKAIDDTTTNLRRVAEHEKKLAEFMKLAAAFAKAGSQLAGAIKQ